MKLNSLLILFFVLAFLVGCGGVSQVATFTPRGSVAPLTIEAKKSTMSEKITFSINATDVCSGSVDTFSATTELKGTYEHRKVLVKLEQVSKLSGTPVHCTVLIDGEVAASFDIR